MQDEGNPWLSFRDTCSWYCACVKIDACGMASMAFTWYE